MWCKLFLVAFLAATLVQAYVVETPEEQLTNYELTQQLTGEFDKFKAIIEKAITKTRDALNSLKVKLQAEADKIVGSLKAELQHTTDKILAEVQALEDKAKKAGVDISDCLAGRKETIVNLPGNLGQNIVQCGVDEVNTGIQIIDDGLSLVDRALNDVDSLSQEFKDCKKKSSFKKAACYAKVTAKIAQEATSIPQELLAIEERATQYVENVATDIEACGKGAVQQAKDQGEATLKEIAKCVAGKLIPI